MAESTKQGQELINATVFLVDAVLLHDRNPSSLWSSEFPLKGCKITGTCAFRVHTKHDQTLFWLSLLLQPSLLPISVATDWLDLPRFANREQFQTHLSATHPHGMLQLKSNIKHIHSIRVHPRLRLMACCEQILYSTWATIEAWRVGQEGRRRRLVWSYITCS